MKLSKITYISKDKNFPIVKKNPSFWQKGWLRNRNDSTEPRDTCALPQQWLSQDSCELWAGRLDPKHKNHNLNTDFCCPRLQQRQNKVWCEFSVWSNAFLVFWLVKFNNTSWARKPQEERKLVFLLHEHYVDSKFKFLYGTIFTPPKNSGLPHGF